MGCCATQTSGETTYQQTQVQLDNANDIGKGNNVGNDVDKGAEQAVWNESTGHGEKKVNRKETEFEEMKKQINVESTLDHDHNTGKDIKIEYAIEDNIDESTESNTSTSDDPSASYIDKTETPGSGTINNYSHNIDTHHFEPVFNKDGVKIVSKSRMHHNRRFLSLGANMVVVYAYFRRHGINPTDIANIVLKYYDGSWMQECLIRISSFHVFRMILCKCDAILKQNMVCRFTYNDCHAVSHDKHSIQIGVVGARYHTRTDNHKKDAREKFCKEFKTLSGNSEESLKNFSFRSLYYDRAKQLSDLEFACCYLNFRFSGYIYTCTFCSLINNILNEEELYNSYKYSNKYCISFQSDIKTIVKSQQDLDDHDCDDALYLQFAKSKDYSNFDGNVVLMCLIVIGK